MSGDGRAWVRERRRALGVPDGAQEAACAPLPPVDARAGPGVVLLREEDGTPHILARDHPDANAPAIVALLRERLDALDVARSSIAKLLERHDALADRDRIKAALRACAAGEMTPDQARGVLGLPSVIQLVLLGGEFGIRVSPFAVDASTDVADGADAAAARHDARRLATGELSDLDWVALAFMLRNGASEASIRDTFDVPPDRPVPTLADVEAHYDRSLYGIDPDAPPRTVLVRVTVGERYCKLAVEEPRAADGRSQVADHRWVGRQVGEAVQAAVDRIRSYGRK